MHEKTKNQRMSNAAKRRCTAEWKARQALIHTKPVPVEEIAALYASGCTQAEIADKFSVSTSLIYLRMKQHGLKARVAAKRNQWADKHPLWKGDQASYTAFHNRLQRRRGKAKACFVCGTTKTGKTYDWANLNGKLHDVSDYAAMCRSCHRKYDNKRSRERADARP